MKIVFSDVPMNHKVYSFRYGVDDNPDLAYDGEVVFPVSAVLAKNMQKGEKVKVVMLAKTRLDTDCENNCEIFRQELDRINKGIGADIEYVTLRSPVEERREVQDMLLKDMIHQLEEGAEVFADVTYGPKSLPIIVFTALNFAEKFFDADIRNIIYGKVDFVDDGSGTGNTMPVNPVLYDLTPLYCLNNVINVMECSSQEDALKALDILLNM